MTCLWCSRDNIFIVPLSVRKRPGIPYVAHSPRKIVIGRNWIHKLPITRTLRTILSTTGYTVDATNLTWQVTTVELWREKRIEIFINRKVTRILVLCKLPQSDHVKGWKQTVGLGAGLEVSTRVHQRSWPLDTDGTNNIPPLRLNVDTARNTEESLTMIIIDLTPETSHIG